MGSPNPFFLSSAISVTQDFLKSPDRVSGQGFRDTFGGREICVTAGSDRGKGRAKHDRKET